MIHTLTYLGAEACRSNSFPRWCIDLSSRKGRNGNKVESCSLVRTGGREPVKVVSEILRRSGVRIGRVDKTTSQITGRIGSLVDPYYCKVAVRVYNQRELSLVELVCEGSWRGPGAQVLSTYVEILSRNFDDTLTSETCTVSDLEADISKEDHSYRGSRGAVVLLRDIEAELAQKAARTP